MKPILITGIQPTGRLHLGNYLGTLENFVKLQNSGEYRCFFFIADYHSMTVEYDPAQKQTEIINAVQAAIAGGIDPKKTCIFVQSSVPEHTELAWILNTLTPMGELERMTQYKDKKEFGSNAGLFTYPVLMAADILLYNAKFVPVGEDQVQHLELARTLARKFNSRYGETFSEPQQLLSKIPRVMSLSDPAKKMSKTSPEGCLFLDDGTEEIKNKIMRSVTDSGNEIKFDEENKPGISNLLLIYEALSGMPINELENKYAGKGYGQFKSDLARLVIEKLSPFRDNKPAKSAAMKIIAAGGKKARQIASKEIKLIRKKIGLLTR